MSLSTRSSVVAYHEGAHPFVRTPALDCLRRDGVTFSNAFVQFTTCVPSRASMATGRYAHELGMWNHRCRIPDHIRTTADILDAAGYETVAFGRTHDQHKGFRKRVANHAGIQGFGTTHLGNEAPSEEIIGVYPGPAREQHDMHAAIRFSEWIGTRRDDRPFFAHIGFMAPHAPYWPPAEYADAYDPASITLPRIGDGERRSQNAMQRHVAERRWLTHSPDVRRRILARYFDLVSYGDACLGVALEALDARGLLRDTAIVFTSDHGDMLGEHEMIAKWFSLYDEALRVPLVVRLPSGGHAGSCRTQNVELVDLAPTLVELAGAAGSPDPDLEENRIPHEPFSGMSLLPLLAEPGLAHKEAVFSMHENAHMIRTSRHKLVVYAERRCFNYPDSLFAGADGAGELYDLTNDSGEHRNLYSDPACASLKAELSVRLIQHLMRHHSWLGKHGGSRH